MSETAIYLSITLCALGMVTLIETLVNFPVLDCCVVITAPMSLNSDSILAIPELDEGKINLNKNTDGQSGEFDNSSFNLV